MKTFATLLLSTALSGTAFAQAIVVAPNSNVGIGAEAPATKLEIAQNAALKIGQAFFSSGGNYAHIANNEWFDGSIWRTYNIPGALLQLGGQDVSFYTHDGYGQHIPRVKILGNGNVVIGGNSPTPGVGLDVASSESRIAANGLYFKGSGINPSDGLPWARLVEGWGMRFNSPDPRWTLSTSGSFLAGYVADGRDWGWGNAYISGNVGIGTVSLTHKLTVNGQVKSRGFITDNGGWSDYVFAEDYKLASLDEVEAHIKEKRHLPGVPSEADVLSKGLDLGQMSAVQMAKIEELMLHVIELNKQVKAQQARIEQLENQSDKRGVGVPQRNQP